MVAAFASFPLVFTRRDITRITLLPSIDKLVRAK